MGFIDRLFNRKDTKEVIAKEVVTDPDLFLVDASEFLNLLKINSIPIINPSLAAKIENRLAELQMKWPDSTLETKKAIFDEYYSLMSEYTSYMNNKGNDDLLKLRIELAINTTEKIKYSSSKNLKPYPELIKELEELKNTLNQIPKIGNNPRIMNILNETEYYIQKNAITLLRRTKKTNIPIELITKFKDQILKQALEFVNSKQTEKYLVDLQHSLKLTIAYGDLNDIEQVSKIFNLLIDSNIDYIYEIEKKEQEIELKIVPDLKQIDLNNIEKRIKELFERIKELKIYDQEGYESFLNKLANFKIEYFLEKTDPINVEKLEMLRKDFETYMNEVGLKKIYGAQIETTLKRIETISDAELFKLIEEIKTDKILLENKEINAAINKRYLAYRQKQYEELKAKNYEEIPDIMTYKDNILSEAKLVLIRFSLKSLNEEDQRLIDDIKEIINQELDEFNILRLLAYLKTIGNRNPDPTLINQAYKKLYPLNSNVNFQKRDYGNTKEYYFLNRDDFQESKTILSITNEENQSLPNYFYTESFSEYSFYKTFLLFPDLITKLIEMIVRELSKDENRLIPKIILREENDSLRLIIIKAIKNHLINNIDIINVLKDEKKFMALRYIFEDYRDDHELNNEIKAKNALITVIPEIMNNVDGVLQTLNIFFKYYEDFEVMDKAYKETISLKYSQDKKKKK